MTKQRILVVDDDEGVRNLLSEYFINAGFEVSCVEDGASSLQAVQEFHPDIVVLDIMLPEMDGLSVLRELRRAGSIPVIALTARGDEVDRILGLEMGADDYVVKPFSPGGAQEGCSSSGLRGYPGSDAARDDGQPGQPRGPDG